MVQDFRKLLVEYQREKHDHDALGDKRTFYSLMLGRYELHVQAGFGWRSRPYETYDDLACYTTWEVWLVDRGRNEADRVLHALLDDAQRCVYPPTEPVLARFAWAHQPYWHAYEVFGHIITHAYGDKVPTEDVQRIYADLCWLAKRDERVRKRLTRSGS